MPAAEYNFSIEKGAVFYISFEYKDSTNTTINLTNWCARISIESADAGQPITSFSYISDATTPEYSFTIDPSLGKIILQLSASTTQAFNFSTARYDLDLKAPNELYPGSGPQIIKLLKGFITVISSNVTNPEPFDCNIITEDPCLTCE
jgi:hypothetical protein